MLRLVSAIAYHNYILLFYEDGTIWSMTEGDLYGFNFTKLTDRIPT